MPVHLEPQDVSVDLEKFKSVLIVSCPVCPPMCLAMQKNSPFIEFFKRGIKTGAFEDYIQSIRKPLEQRGVRTGAFTIHVPTPMMCLWTKGQRSRLLKRARDYEAVLVLGCDSATHSAQETLKDTDCQVIQGMRMVGTTNATLRFRFPLTIDLHMNCVLKNDTASQHITDVGETMMQDMMQQCCTEDGKPDFERMMKFMQSCDKQGFSEGEIAMMKQFCGEAGRPDPGRMKQLMEKCGCHVS
jgi:hypothetical protein